jgi:hypothetical protein
MLLCDYKSLAAATLMGIINQIKLEALPEDVPEGITEGKRAQSSISKKSASESDKDAQAFAPVEETEKSLRMATASFPQWTADLVAKMFKLYSAMLEISSTGDRNGRGITKDERLASFATYTMDTVAVNLSPAALEPIVQQVYDNTMGHIEASALRIVPGLIGTVAREGKTARSRSERTLRHPQGRQMFQPYGTWALSMDRYPSSVTRCVTRFFTYIRRGSLEYTTDLNVLSS